MILNHNNLTIKTSDIQIKKPQQYSDQFIFYPINYQKKEFLIQTPKLCLIDGIQQYSTINTNKYLDLSFQNKHFDKSIIHYQNNLTVFYEKVLSFFKNKYVIEPFIKQNYKFECMRCKISDTCLFFDKQKEIIKDIKNIQKTYGIFIIHLHGLWLMNQTIWFDWKIIQGQLDIPIQLTKCIINHSIIPKPPPLPPPPPPSLDKYQKMLKIGVHKKAVEQKKCMDRIKASDLQNVKLKRTKHSKKKHKINDPFTPSLDEIRNALQCLQKIN